MPARLVIQAGAGADSLDAIQVLWISDFVLTDTMIEGGCCEVAAFVWGMVNCAFPVQLSGFWLRLSFF